MPFSDVPIRVNGQDFFVSWVNLLRAAGVALETNVGQWTKYTVAHTDLQAAATTNDIELFSLAAKETITGIIVKSTTAFAGTGITAYDVSIGITGDLIKHMPFYDILQAAGDTVFNQVGLESLEDFGSATSIRIQGKSTGANLDQSSAGSVDIYVRKSTLP